MGYVYIAEVEALGCCKIGIAERSVNGRIRSIQTGCPEKITRVWQSRNIPDNRRIERMLHKKFANSHTHGEWFKTPYMQIVIEADKMCKNGADAQKIAELEAENRRLREEIDGLYKQIGTVK